MQSGTRPRQRQTETPRYQPGERVAVLLPLPLSTASGGAYDDRAPAGEALADGDFVAVPLGHREVRGNATFRHEVPGLLLRHRHKAVARQPRMPASQLATG